MRPDEFKSGDPVAWCPGCGDFGILNALTRALAELAVAPKDILLVSGIGQAAKLPHYVRANCFNGLHGRALPAAVGAKICNRALTVIVTTGDGDCYGEGGNHLIHNIRRNVDITVIVHNNQIYGLTKGQASPTTDPGFVTKFQPHGVIAAPLRALEMAVVLGAPFVARGFSANIPQLVGLIVEGVRHPGFSLIEVLQPCVTFNKVNTFAWYAKRVYRLGEDGSYDPADRAAACARAAEWGDRIPTGILYRKARPTYEELSGVAGRPPLVEDRIDAIDLDPALAAFREQGRES